MLKKQSRYRPTSLLVGVSLCVSSILVAPGNAAAAACQSGEAGCVLPVGAAPPAPAPVRTTTPAPVYVDEDGGGGIGWLPILLGLAALAAVYFLFLNDDDEGSVSP